MAMRKPVRLLFKVAVVLAVAAAGGVLTGLLYNEISNNESSLSTLGFQAAFSPLVGTFKAYIEAQLRCVFRAIVSISTRRAQPSCNS